MKCKESSRLHRLTHLLPVVIHLYFGVGVDRQVISEVILAVVRRFYAPTEEQHGLWAGVGPRQDALLVYTTQHLRKNVWITQK